MHRGQNIGFILGPVRICSRNIPEFVFWLYLSSPWCSLYIRSYSEEYDSEPAPGFFITRCWFCVMLSDVWPCWCYKSLGFYRRFFCAQGDDRSVEEVQQPVVDSEIVCRQVKEGKK